MNCKNRITHSVINCALSDLCCLKICPRKLYIICFVFRRLKIVQSTIITLRHETIYKDNTENFGHNFVHSGRFYHL